MTNHYETLGITRSATSDDIRNAYRRMALQYHPDRNREASATAKFQKVAEAYDILSDNERKRNYDQELDGNVRGGGGRGRPFEFNRDPMNMFNSFFAKGNLFNDGLFNMGNDNGTSGMFFMNTDGVMNDGMFGGRQKKERVDPPVVQNLNVSLNDVLKGTTKNMIIRRKIVENNNSRTEEKNLEVVIKPGCTSGTKYTFPKEGDINPGRVPADIVFVIQDEEHPHFKRRNTDIVYVAKIDLKSALCGVDLTVPTLDGPAHLLQLTEVVNSKTQKRLTGKGLPISKTPNIRGDLVVEFDIEFPSSLTEEKKEALKNLLY